jgi:hypothetical protein
MPGSTTERRIVQILNDYYTANEIDAFAHRLKQGRFAQQHIDILSLSTTPRYYLGIEAKSALKIDINGRPFTILYYTRYFTTAKDGSSQVTRTDEYLNKCGLNGYLAFELRAGSGGKNHIWFVPFEDLVENFEAGESGMTLEQIQTYPDVIEVGVEGVL